MNIVGQSTNGDEEEVRTGRLGGHTREREGLNYLVYEAVYSASCPLVQVACPFITLTPSRGKKYAQLRIHYSVILLAVYTPFHNVLSKPSI